MARLLLVAAVAALVALASCTRHRQPRGVPEAPMTAGSPLVPLPVESQRKDGHFRLTAETVIVAPGPLEPLGQYLSRHIGLGVGPQPLRVEPTVDTFAGGAIVLSTAESGAMSAEEYELDVSPTTVRISGGGPAGVFYAIQTLRQMLPPRFEYEALRPPRRGDPTVQVPAVLIRDRPRFVWRGAMLDVARHFLSVQDVKRYIDLMALHKLNRLHLHLSDDQGWRIDIRAWPNLARYGGSTEVGSGSGGYYTQEQYSEIVRYAASRFITIVPEIDMPGHTNAALASYAELNCDGVARQLYTGIEVGFSALCVEKDVTFRFIDDVVREISALTPGGYFHIGGDEVKTLSPQQYAAFIERVQEIVRSHGLVMIGWDEIAEANLAPGSIVQHWRPKTTPEKTVARGASVIMSLADRAYLDMKYDTETPIGLAWAGIVSIQTSYEWDPGSAAHGVPESAVLGVEAPLWTETVADINDAEFLAFPRLAALAEVGWSPQPSRAWGHFRERLGAQAPRWIALGMNFYRSSEVEWR